MNATSKSTTKLGIIDFRVSRGLFALPGGNMGLAIGGEYRKERLSNPSLSGSENGTINASYVAAFGDTKVKAIYAKILAPAIKTVELSAAMRYDKYDNFSSSTPKAGIKWTPVKSFALRGTYTESFRAPGPAEGNATSQSTGSAPVRDPVRCPGGVPADGGGTSTDCAGTPKNKINLMASWDLGDLNVTGNVNYRDKMRNTADAASLCANTFVGGANAPNAKCEIASFTTLDLSTRYAVNKQLTLFASMNNVLDKVAPLDPQTYGGMSYNPMDASGAIGRYMKVGASYKFF